MIPMDITLVALVVSAAIFLFSAIQSSEKSRTYRAFFLATGSLGKGDNSASYVARFTSLATVLAFFLIFAKFDGLYLLVAPVTVLLGVLLFARLFSRMQLPPFRSLDDLVTTVYGSRVVGMTALAVAVVALIVTLLIEIFLGVQIFAIFIDSESTYFPVNVMLVSGIAFLYTGMGGLLAVVKTDRIQAYLIYITVPTLAVALYWTANLTSVSWFPRSPIIAGENFPQWIVILPLALLLNVTVVNLFLLPSLLSTWQLSAATKDASSFVAGLRSGGYRAAFLWSMFIICGLIIASSGANINSLFEFFVFLRDYPNWFVSYICFPLLFIGAGAALLSTADSAIIPLAQFAYDRLKTESQFSKGFVSILLFGGWLIINVFYVIIFNILKIDFISILFTVFGLSVAVSPAILLGALYPHLANSFLGRTCAMISMIGGFGVAVLLSFTGQLTDQVYLVQLGAPVGFCIALIALAPVMIKGRGVA